jgi:hypothetical protein
MEAAAAKKPSPRDLIHDSFGQARRRITSAWELANFRQIALGRVAFLFAASTLRLVKHGRCDC